MTALYQASREGHTEIVKLLLAEHATVNFIVNRPVRQTAFDIAMKNGHTKIADLLNQAGGRSAAELEN